MANKIIAVWGANGNGKTSVAASLGVALSERNFMVGVISSKLCYGELQILFGKKLNGDKGLYKAISSGNNTKNMFEGTNANSNLFFLSVPTGFDGMLLTALSGDGVKELLEDAAMRFDYIIIDGSEELNNPVSSIGLTMANKVVVVHRASAKDCAWQKSMENSMQLLNINSKAVHILNGYDKTCDKMAYLSNIGVKMSFELPYVPKAKIFENSGKSLMTAASPGEYKKTMQRLASSLIM